MAAREERNQDATVYVGQLDDEVMFGPAAAVILPSKPTDCPKTHTHTHTHSLSLPSHTLRTVECAPPPCLLVH